MATAIVSADQKLFEFVFYMYTDCPKVSTSLHLKVSQMYHRINTVRPRVVFFYPSLTLFVSNSRTTKDIFLKFYGFSSA